MNPCELCGLIVADGRPIYFQNEVMVLAVLWMCNPCADRVMTHESIRVGFIETDEAFRLLWPATEHEEP